MKVNGYSILQRVIPRRKSTAMGTGKIDVMREWLHENGVYHAFLLVFGFLYITRFDNDRVMLSYAPIPGVKGFWFYFDDIEPYIQAQRKASVD